MEQRSSKAAGEQPQDQSATEYGEQGPASKAATPESSVPEGSMSSDSSGPPDPPSQSLTDLYKDWVNLHTSRTELYQKRILAAKCSLEFDIKAWKKALEAAARRDRNTDESDRLTVHHVTQFGKFVENGYTALLDLPEKQKLADAAELEDFRALVVGVFTSQWLLLRDVVLQRAAGSPYRPGLRILDKQAKGFYARLYDVLKPSLDTAKIDQRYRDAPLADFAPLVYLGNIAQLSVFNRRVPLMLSVPFGALPDAPASKDTGMAIPHEVSHTVFAQVPELIEEIKGKLKQQLDNKQGLSRSKRVLYNMAIQWTEEICADLFGTALAGEANATSARWVMAGSDSMSGVTDETHPPALLRPMIHLLALTSIGGVSGGAKFAETRRFFEAELKDKAASIQLFGRQFRSVPALMYVPIATVSDVVIDLIEGYLLKMKLDILKGRTMEELLRAINASTMEELPKQVGVDGFDRWGESPDINSKEFVLDFPSKTAPTYGTPGVSKHPDCCAIWFLESLCC
jgi:hypothetical protein